MISIFSNHKVLTVLQVFVIIISLVCAENENNPPDFCTYRINLCLCIYILYIYVYYKNLCENLPYALTHLLWFYGIWLLNVGLP